MNYRLNIRFSYPPCKREKKDYFFHIQLHLRDVIDVGGEKSETKMQTVFFYFDCNVLRYLEMTLKAEEKISRKFEDQSRK